MFRNLDPKIAKRLERRFDEMQIDQEAFIRRFDLNNDGVLDAQEIQAAQLTLVHELLREDALSAALGEGELQPNMMLKNRFHILSKIGSGAQGIAYAATDEHDSNELVVIKQLRLSHLDAWDAYDSFRREAEILARLSHPQLPHFIDAFEVHKNGKYFYFSVQGLMAGKNLADRLACGELFSEDNLISIASQCLDILSYLHNHKPSVLHRDIKPSNLLIDDVGRVSLVDFGAVQYAKTSKTMAVGTTGYMAAEQLLGQALPQSDLYALGATLIRLATRIEPHELDLRQMRMVWRPFSSLSSGFSNWIDKLIDPEVEDRFINARSAKDFLDKRQSVFVRTEELVEDRLSLHLIEKMDGKPANSRVRIWESVDQFVCTFPPRPGSHSFGIFSEIMGSLFQRKNYNSLSRLGGGFNSDGDAKIQIRSATNQLNYRKFIRIENETFDGDDLGLIGVYEVKSKSGSHEVRVALIVGLTQEELKWVRKLLSLFLASHHHRIMPYQPT